VQQPPPPGPHPADPGRPVPAVTRPDPDSPHRGPNLNYIPSLDGVRAFAVLGVMAFHGGIPFMSGGFLGVDTFFVLSGFLITTLLLTEWRGSATLRLGAFWARRARRLVPALLLLLLGVAAYAEWAVAKGTYPGLRLDALSTLLYVANWHFILSGSNYFAQTALSSPLTHTWSLAIEEQFYIFWPIVVLGVLKVWQRTTVLFVVAAVGALASALWMAVLYHPLGNLTRLYYGTDTHAQCLLVGASLAIGLSLWADRRTNAPARENGWAPTTERARWALVLCGVAGFVATGLLWWRVAFSDAFLWRGGFLVAALATAAVLVSIVTVERGPVARLLAWGPLRFLGRISYGMYLYHYPLFLYLDAARTGLTGYPLFAVRSAVTIGAATVSFFLVERPIRQGTFVRSWRAWVLTPAAALVTVAVVIAATEVPVSATTPFLLSTAPSGNAALYKGPPVRVLLVGDSVALTLGLGMSQLAPRYDVVEDDQGILGCGVAIGAEIQLKGVDSVTASPCQPVPPPGKAQWPRLWADEIASFRPNVVVYLGGRWEVANRTWNGRWTDISDPAYAAYIRGQLDEAVRVATARGARFVMMTAPCYDSGEQPDGAAWPEDSPRRLAIYNGLVRQVGAAHPGTVTVLDLDALVCPGGHFEQVIDGVTVRQSDGVHFTVPLGLSATAGANPDGGEWLAPKLWPAIVQVGRAQMAGAPDPS
jgi:peptidoglycan/LPS O-acetylase OafA/YrhL